MNYPLERSAQYGNREQQHLVVLRPAKPVTPRLPEPSRTRKGQDIEGYPALPRTV